MKNFIKKYKLVPDKIGVERRQEILNNIDDNGTFLPKGIEISDMDKSFIKSVDTDMEIFIEGEKVPVRFMNSQRWSEFARTFDFTNEFKSLKIPFISIVRNPDIQPGTNQMGNWNIPQGKRTYTYVKVPVWDGVQKGVDTYKIPQPTCVDLSYEVRLFCDRVEELNKIHKKIQLLFQSRQHYISVKGHPMPIHLEAVSDESTMSDFENRRFYVQKFEMKLLGYLLNEEDFEIIPSINRAIIKTELMGSKKRPTLITNQVDNKLSYKIIFKDNSDNRFDFIMENNSTFNKLSDINNVLSILIFKNDSEIFNGVVINNDLTFDKGDKITISIARSDDSKISSFNIKGITQ